MNSLNDHMVEMALFTAYGSRTMLKAFYHFSEEYNFFLNDNNLDGALVNYYKNIAEIEKDNVGKGWKLAFEQTFGINIEQFYTDFDNFMLLPREDQIAILK